MCHAVLIAKDIVGKHQRSINAFGFSGVYAVVNQQDGFSFAAYPDRIKFFAFADHKGMKWFSTIGRAGLYQPGLRIYFVELPVHCNHFVVGGRVVFVVPERQQSGLLYPGYCCNPNLKE